MKKYLLVLVSLVIIASCGKDSPKNGGSNDFDKSALQTNLVDNIILPAYADLNTKLSDLNTAKESFIATPDQPKLTELKTAWLNAYKVWQHVEVFNIGKAEELKYAMQMNVYPTNTTEIESNIMAGNANLSSDENNDAVGFPALDYMLYEVAMDKYTTDTNAAKYKAHLSDLVNRMIALTTTVSDDWTTYKSSFISSVDNTTSSKFNKFVNDYIYNYEKIIRSNKLGIPAGVFSGGNLLPNRVEAYYNEEVSKELMLEAYNASIDLFNGKSYSGAVTGESYNSYLIHLGKESLATDINNKFTAAKEAIQALSSNFVTQINSNNTTMLSVYDLIQAATVKLKVDMLNEFDVTIDYVDSDGD